MKRRSISPASRAQREKIKGHVCANCRLNVEEWPTDPAHLWDRSRGGCDDPLCVVPLCRPCHRAYDEHKIDLLPALLTNGYHDEMAHVISAHRISPTRLLERITNERWEPAPSAYPQKGSTP